MMKKILVLMICAALCLSLIPAASADGVILWERLDTGDVIAMTRQPTEEELKNLKLHTHSYGDWVVITQASCSEAGLRYRICSKCGYKDTETIGKTEHSFMWIVTVREATCTSEGYGYQKCARCGYMQEYVIPRVPHSYGGWSTVKETTDHSAGIRQRSCYVCGFIQSESFDPPGTLRRGSQGSSVREMQALLSQQGYLASGYVDGDFGYYTEKAVMDFQKAINITADGVAWPQTLNLLHHKFGEWKVVREPDYYSVALLERVCEDCGYKESKEIGVMLQLGDYNENVKTLQKRLNALGYDVGYPDGLFGDGTKRAVKNYQKAQGFEEDGIVWPGVWTALFPEDLSDLPAKTGYYSTKPALVLGISTWLWDKYLNTIIKEKHESKRFKNMTGAEAFEDYLDLFLDMYRNHADMLRFNQFFNVYLQSEDIPAEDMKPYEEAVGELEKRFETAYKKGIEDGTLRSDIPMTEIFSSTAHLMLAAVTRYAVGLAYTENTDAEKELELLKSVLLKEYAIAG